MIEIKKSSWHYKVLQKYTFSMFYKVSGPPKDLCEYVRRHVVCITSFLALMAVLLASLVGMGLGTAPYGLADGFTPFEWAGYFALWGLLMWCGLVICTIAAGLVVSVLQRGLWWMVGRMRGSTPRQFLLMEWVKAKKGKYCPRIVYKD